MLICHVFLCYLFFRSHCHHCVLHSFPTRRSSDLIVEGMHGVYKYGTASATQIPGIEICGKTGTAENFTRINGKRVQLTDHSIFIAFAPKDDPKIAIAVFVENGRWGSRYAARVASLVIGKYLKGTVDRKDMEEWILENGVEGEDAKE